MEKKSLKSYTVLTCALLFGLVFAMASYQQNYVGISIFLITLLMVGCLSTIKSIRGGGLGFADFFYIPILLSSLAPAFSQNERLVIFSILFTWISLFVVGIYNTWGEDIRNFTFLTNLKIWVQHYFQQFIGIKNFGIGVDKIKKTDIRQTASVLTKILAGTLIALPFLCIFLVLFVSADELFLEVFENILPDVTLKHWGFYAIWGFVSFVSFFWFLGYMFGENKSKKDHSESLKTLIDPTVMIVTSILVNLLFVLFVAAQFVYLFGGKEAVTDLGIVYSEYAVKGFNEMVAISMISVFFIYLLNSIVHKDKTKVNVALNLSLILNVLFNLVIVYSSYTRIDLYVDTYGLTDDRFYVYVAQIFAVLVFSFLLLTLTSDTRKHLSSKSFSNTSVRYLSLYAMVVLLLTTFVTGLVNPDATIAKYNVNRYLANQESEPYSSLPNRVRLDLDYLTYLSSDAHVHVLDGVTNGEYKLCDFDFSIISSNWDREKDGRGFWAFNVSHELIADDMQSYIEKIEKNRSKYLVEDCRRY